MIAKARNEVSVRRMECCILEVMVITSLVWTVWLMKKLTFVNIMETTRIRIIVITNVVTEKFRMFLKVFCDMLITHFGEFVPHKVKTDKAGCKSFQPLLVQFVEDQ